MSKLTKIISTLTSLLVTFIIILGISNYIGVRGSCFSGDCEYTCKGIKTNIDIFGFENKCTGVVQVEQKEGLIPQVNYR